MFDAGIKINYAKIEKKMGKEMSNFVHDTVSNIDPKTALNTRIKISTFKGGELDGSNASIESGLIILNNVRDFVSIKAKQAGLNGIFKKWKHMYLDKKVLSELFSVENVLEFLRKTGNSK